MNELEANIVDTMTFLRYGEPLERNQKWLLKQIDTPELQELAEKLSILSIQVLNEIARNSNQSAADIANELNVTRGGISRVAKRLIQDDLIKEIRKKDNQKEINYHLTEKGNAIFQVHLKLLKGIEKQHLAIIRSFNEEEQTAIFNYLEKVSELSVE